MALRSFARCKQIWGDVGLSDMYLIFFFYITALMTFVKYQFDILLFVGLASDNRKDHSFFPAPKASLRPDTHAFEC
jgi:hypothetical protein